jgi:NAD(P)-dependent dehydrogenase (short-subunit alcohol dehydrogenase family)
MSTVLITGANRGVGLELVKVYAARGDKVLAFCEVSVSDGASVAALAESIGDQPIDILINNAGMAGPSYDQQSVLAMDFDGWAETFAVNTMAPVRVMQALMDNLKASSDARVVNITSQMGAMSLDMPVMYAYCTSKAALNKFMKMAALELGKQGINVCLIHPGFVKTDMGGPNADITPQESAEGIAAVVDGLNSETNGSFWKWDGGVHGW